MSIFDRFYAGKRNYSVPFICALLLVGATGLTVLFALMWTIAETVEHFTP